MYRVDDYGGYECEHRGYRFGPERSLTGSYVWRKRRERFEQERGAKITRAILEALEEGYDVQQTPSGHCEVTHNGTLLGIIDWRGDFRPYQPKAMEWADNRR